MSIEPFFFNTQGEGVIYLAFKAHEPTGKTYISTGTFQNINPTGDSKRIYYLDGRYTDVMNDASIFGKTYVSDTHVHTKAQAKKMIKEYTLDINADLVTLYSHSDFYWFLQNGLLSKRMVSKNYVRSTSKSLSKKRKYNT
jgi:hypothetical protein